MTEAVHNSMNVIEVFPYEASNVGIFGNGFISPLQGLIARSGATDGSVIEKGLGNIRDFWLKKESDIAVKNSDCIGGTLREDSAPVCSEGCLKRCEVTGRYVEDTVVIAHKKIKHGVARSSCHSFNELINEWRDGGVANCDGIEGL